MEDINWKDITSYSQRDKEKIPTTLELRKLSPFDTKLILHRHIYFPDTWLVTCKGTGIDKVNLHTNDIEEAKKLAIDYMMDYGEKLLDKWNGILGSLKRD